MRTALGGNPPRLLRRLSQASARRHCRRRWSHVRRVFLTRAHMGWNDLDRSSAARYSGEVVEGEAYVPLATPEKQRKVT